MAVTGFWIFLVSSLIPGVLGDTNTIGGLVSAAVVAFIFLAVIIAIIVMTITWNTWYPARQLKRGRVKMSKARMLEKEQIKKSQKYLSRMSSQEVNGGPSFVKSYATTSHSVRSSHYMPTPRMGFTEKAAFKRYTWIQEERPSKYEDKEKSMTFGEEEGDVIVTEVLQDTFKEPVPAPPAPTTSIRTTIPPASTGFTPEQNGIPMTDFSLRQTHLSNNDEAVAILSASKKQRDEEDMVLY